MKRVAIAITLLAAVSGNVLGVKPGLRASIAQMEHIAAHAELTKTRNAMKEMEERLIKGEAIDMAEYDALSAKYVAASNELCTKISHDANNGTYKYYHATLTEPGTLEDKLGDDWMEIDSLIVSGPMDLDDFFAITACSIAGQLKVANLESAQISNNFLPNYAFNQDYITRVDRVILPENLVGIGEYAFAYSEVRQVNLPSALRSIGMYAFRSCKNYVIPDIPESLTDIPAGCFLNNSDSRTVEIPSSIRTIGESAFYDTRLTELKLNEGLETICDLAFFGCESLEKLELPSTCTKIYGTGSSGRTFGEMFSLKYIKLPDNLTDIPNECFTEDRALESIEIPGKVYSIGTKAFYGCSALREVTLKNGISIVCSNAFEGCPIESLLLPRSIIAIDSYCFGGNSKLQRIYSENPEPPVACSYWVNDIRTSEVTVPENWQKPFEGCPKDIPVYVPVGSADKYRATWGWDYFTNFIETTDFPTSAIDEVSADSMSDAPAEYYNLQGIRVNEPQPGNIYIRRQGNRVSKIRF